MPIKEIRKNGKIGRIFHEEYADYCNPRDNENIAVMFCQHPRYTLGDIQIKGNDVNQVILNHFGIDPKCGVCGNDIEYMDNAFGGWIHSDAEEDDEGAYRCDGKPIIPNFDMLYHKPLYLYDHSGLSLSTGFSGSVYDMWDTSMVGYAVISRKDMATYFPDIIDIAEIRERAEQVIDGEVREYSAYLGGEVYRYEVEDEEGNLLDSCSGFIGMEYCEQEMNAILDHMGEAITQ